MNAPAMPPVPPPRTEPAAPGPAPAQARRALAAAAISGLFVALFVFERVALYFVTPSAESLELLKDSQDLLTYAIVAVLGYWLGSSHGSDLKTRIMARQDGPPQ